MEGCPTCENWGKEQSNIIMENAHARAVFVDAYREGHSLVFVKRHIQSISAIEPDEYHSVFDLITKVSKALEKKYSARKTYLITVGDSDKFQHLHFHLIPKHRNLPSMGVYCFQKLWEVEPPRKTPDAEKMALAREIKGIIEGK
jgi:diadenosine tetraphosphate (Ap4A) HIT family hydrolase